MPKLIVFDATVYMERTILAPDGRWIQSTIPVQFETTGLTVNDARAGARLVAAQTMGPQWRIIDVDVKYSSKNHP